MNRLTQFIIALFLLLNTASSFATPVNINTANAQEIATAMQGIGIKKAEAIVAFRNSNGPFKDVLDITQVKGIGKKTVDLNKEKITVVNTD